MYDKSFKIECYILMQFLFFFFFLLFRATFAAHGSSQVSTLIRATAAGLYHSHSHVGSKLCLQPASQLTATPDL